jgi:MFS family permease
VVGNQTEGGIAAGEWRSGWRTLTAAFCGTAVGWHTFQIISGIFLLPMQSELGWSRSMLAIGPIGALLSMALYVPAGILIDRFGPRRMAILGLILLSASYATLACIPAEKYAYFLAVGLLAVAGSVTNGIVFSRGLATWFKVRFGTALGLMMTGTSVMSAIALPALALVIGQWGWRAGFAGLAGLVLLVGIPMLLLWFRTSIPRDVASHVEEGHSMSEAIRDKRFWILILAFALAALPIGGFLTHLQPMLRDGGWSPGMAASFGSVFAVAIGIGRIAVGILMDRINPSMAAGGSLILSGFGTAVLAFTLPSHASPLVVALGVALIGLAQGAESDYLSFFSLRMFGTRSYSRIVGIMSMVAGGGMAIGGFIFAGLYDHFGNYEFAMRAAAISYIVGALVLFSVRAPRTEEFARQ